MTLNIEKCGPWYHNKISTDSTETKGNNSRFILNANIAIEIKILSVETDADKIRLGYAKFVTILLMIMLIGINMLNNETLRIPKC